MSARNTLREAFVSNTSPTIRAALVFLAICCASATLSSGGKVRVIALPTSFSVQVPVQITEPLQSIPLRIALRPVDVSRPATYRWSTTANKGYTNPDEDRGVYPVSEVSFTYFPGSVPINYADVSIVLSITYASLSGGSESQQYTITFSAEYMVAVLSDRGTASGSGFYAAGTYVRPIVTPTEISESGLIKHQLSGWSVNVSGSPPFSIGPAQAVRVSQVTSMKATWQTSYMIRFSGPENSTESWQPQGTRVTFISPEYVSDGPGRRKALDGFNVSGVPVSGNSHSVIVSSPLSVTALYHEEYYVSVVSYLGTALGSGWYRAGDSVSPTVSPTIINDAPASRWVFAGWNSTLPVKVTQPITLMSSWTREYRVIIETFQGGVELDGWYASGAKVTVEGSPAYDFGNGTKSCFKGWSDGNEDFGRELTVSAPLSFCEVRTLYYKVETYPAFPTVAIVGDHCQDGWAEAGSTISVTVAREVYEAQGVKLVFANFSEPVETSDTELSLEVRGPIRVEVKWARFFLVTADGVHATVEGEGWYQEGSEVNLKLSEETVLESNVSRWRFIDWNGSLPTSANRAIHVEASWQKEHLVQVVSQFGTTSGAGWYEEGAAVKVSVEPRRITLPNGSQVSFKCWLVNGLQIQGDTFLLAGPEYCLAIWELNQTATNNGETPRGNRPHQEGIDPRQATNGGECGNDTSSLEFVELTAVTDYSACTGSGVYPEGSVATVAIEEQTITVSSAERLSFVQWVDDEGRPVSDRPGFDLTLTRNMTIRAVWRREFCVRGRWFEESELVVLTPSPEILSADGKVVERFTCWRLLNGSEVRAETLVLAAKDAVSCREVRTWYCLAKFRVYGTEAVQLRVIFDGGQSVETVVGESSIWCPLGSLLQIDIPGEWSCSDLRATHTRLEDRLCVAVDSPLEVLVTFPTVWFVDEVPIDPLGLTSLQWDSSSVSLALVLSVLFFTSLLVAKSVRDRAQAAVSSKATEPRWMSLEQYIKYVLKRPRKLDDRLRGSIWPWSKSKAPDAQ